MDYKEEQNSELEALDSIYGNDMEMLEVLPFNKFKIQISSDDFDAENETGMSCSLNFTYTATYPDAPPDIEAEDLENLDREDTGQLCSHLLEQAQENLGMVMIFTLVSAGQEWLNVKSDQVKKDREEGALKKLRAEEEAEMKRFEGTRVSVESFLVWRTAFEVETGVIVRREKDLKENRKLTGKELFLRDNTLNESDLKFLDDVDAVKVDESLFQDLDDLAISDEDDEDYVPGQSDSDN